MSRPFLLKQLEERVIPFRRIGTHRRILFSELMQYKHETDGKRREVLDELALTGQRNIAASISYLQFRPALACFLRPSAAPCSIFPGLFSSRGLNSRNRSRNVGRRLASKGSDPFSATNVFA